MPDAAILMPRMFQRAEEMGLDHLSIHVARVRLSSGKMDAACIWDTDAVPVVLVNAGNHVLKHPGVYRATLAHELCHLLQDAGERNLTTSVSGGVEGTGNYHNDRRYGRERLRPRS